MPPNSALSDVPEDNNNNNRSINDKPICVSDSFHFSSFYWKESNASLAGMNTAIGNGDNESDTTSVGLPRSRSGTIADEEDDSVCKFLFVCICLIVVIAMRCYMHTSNQLFLYAKYNMYIRIYSGFKYRW